MMKNGNAPKYVIYRGITYHRYLSKNDYRTILTPNSDNNIVTCDYLSSKYYQDHYLTANQTDILIPESSILDSKEKKYLRRIIKPFRDEIDYIRKETDRFLDAYYLCIYFKNEDVMNFKSFEKGKMYKNMVLGKNYTLEELGL